MKTLYTIILGFWGLIMFGQDSYLFHRDRPFYVTGEVVWFSVHLPDSFEEMTAINVYFADDLGAVKKQFFCSTEGGKIDGYIELPYAWSSGIYQLALFAKQKESKTEELLAKVEIPVYNDIELGDVPMVNKITLPDNVVQPSNNSNLVTKGNVSARNMQSLRLQDLSSGVSVSVVDASLYGAHINEVVQEVSYVRDGTPIQWENSPYLTTMISSTAGAPLRTNVIGVYDQTSDEMHYAKSGIDGQYDVVLSEYYGPRSYHVNGVLFDEYSVVHSHERDNIGMKAERVITMDSTVLNYLTLSQKRKKIYQQYGMIEYELSTQQKKAKYEAPQPNRVYETSSYQNFDDIEAFFEEMISSELSFERSKDGTLTARMYNPNNKKFTNRNQSRYFEKAPVFIIDGIVTKDAARVAAMDFSSVETIGLYYKREDIKRDFGMYSGMPYVMINTKNGDFQWSEDEPQDIVVINGYQYPADIPVIGDEEEISHPLFRPMLHWNPEVKNTSQTYNIRQSDDVSEFQVIVAGRDADGELKVATAKYRSGYIN